MANLNRWARTKRVVSSWTLTIVGIIAFSYAVGRFRAPELPVEAPTFRTETVSGAAFDLMALRGRTVVLNFWATWCGPCRFEVPAISRFAARHPDMEVVGVVSPEPRPRVRAAIEALDIDYDVVLGTRAILDAYGITTFPTTVFVDPSGEVLTVHVGAMLDPQLELAALGL